MNQVKGDLVQKLLFAVTHTHARTGPIILHGPLKWSVINVVLSCVYTECRNFNK